MPKCFNSECITPAELRSCLYKFAPCNCFVCLDCTDNFCIAFRRCPYCVKPITTLQLVNIALNSSCFPLLLSDIELRLFDPIIKVFFFQSDRGNWWTRWSCLSATWDARSVVLSLRSSLHSPSTEFNYLYRNTSPSIIPEMPCPAETRTARC